MHDIRKLETNIGGGINLQCLLCGCVFREDGVIAAAALLDCEEEQRHRNDAELAKMPMMVTEGSEKYTLPSAGH